MLARISFFLSILLCLTGCYQGTLIDFMYKAPNPSTRYFATTGKVMPNEIIINQSLHLPKYKKLLVVALKSPMISQAGLVVNNRGQARFWQQSLQAQGFFSNVVSINNLNNFLYNQNYHKIPSDLYDLDHLQQLQKTYGNFLVIEITNQNGVKGNSVTISVIDPATKITYFKVKRTKIVLIGYSQQLYYPVLNAFEDWIRKNS